MGRISKFFSSLLSRKKEEPNWISNPLHEDSAEGHTMYNPLYGTAELEPEHLYSPARIPAPAPTDMTSQFRAVDSSGFNFGKWSYRNDSDYHQIEQLIQAYNDSLQGTDSGARLKARAALMRAAADYMMKNTLDKDQHQGRKGHIENLFLQLAQTANSDQRIDETLEDITPGLQGLSGTGHDQTTDTIKDIFARTARGEDMSAQGAAGGPVASDALRAIVTTTLGQFDTRTQTAGGHALNQISPNFNGNTTDTFFDESGEGYSTSTFTTQVSGDPENFANYTDVAGTMLHEMTHGTDHSTFGNAMTLGIARDASPDQIKAEMAKRKRVIAAIDAASQAKEGDSSSLSFAKSRLRDRAEYGGAQDKAWLQYFRATHTKAGKGESSSTATAAQKASYAAEKQQLSALYDMQAAGSSHITDKMSPAIAAFQNPDFNFTLLNEYDAVLPQLLMSQQLGGLAIPEKTMRLIKAAALDSHAGRAIARERKEFEAGR
ncbi:hypothetical protein NBH08_04580 [Faecalicatena sp. BF-R-105]|nr:hypothetical protein [Faecalicatena sp. BF-R-105]